MPKAPDCRGRLLWAAIASAISGHLYRDSDVRWLHEHASSYFIEDRESGYSVYRPYHQDFADFLCEPSRELDVQRLITAQLRANAPARDDGARDWARALPYVRSHLSAHAARAGQLDALLTDPAFLVAADPDRLVQHLPAAVSEAGKAAANVYLRSVDKFRSGEEAERMPYLDLAARQRGLKGFVKAGSGQERWPWRALWARWSQADPFRVLVRHDDWIPALLLSDLDGRSVVVSGSHKSGLKATSLEGALLWHDTEHGLTSVATATVAGRRLVVGGCHDGSVRLWELATGNRVGRPFAGHGGSSPSVRAVQIGVVDGRAAVVSAGNDGYLRISDLERQELLFEPIAAFGGSIQDMALGTLDGRAVIVAAASAGKVDDRNLLRVWDLAERRLMRKFSTAKIDFIRALALGVRRGKAIVALATAGHGGIHIVDLKSGAHEVLPLSTGAEAVDSIAIGELRGKPTIFADMMGPIGAWNLAQGRPIGQALGHHQAVTALALGAIDGRPIMVTGSLDRTVRVWELADAVKLHQAPEVECRQIQHVQVARQDQRPIVVAGRPGPGLSIFDLDDGALLDLAAIPNPGDMDREDFPLAVGGSTGRAKIAIGGAGRTVLWEVFKFGHWRQLARNHPNEPVTALAYGAWQGIDVLASAHAGMSNLSKVKLLDMTNNREATQSLSVDMGPIRALALASLRGRELVVMNARTDLRVWDVAAGALCGRFTTKFALSSNAMAARQVDGDLVIVAGSLGGLVHVLRLGDGKESSFRTGDQWIRAVAIGTVAGKPAIIAGGDDRTLSMFSMDGIPLARVDLEGEVADIAVGPNGEIIVGTANGVVALQFHERLWRSQAE